MAETPNSDDSQPQPDDLTTMKVLSPGEVGNQVLLLDENDPVSFGIAVSPKYKPDTPAPLIVSLHPGGSDQQGYGAGSMGLLAYPAFAELNAIFLGPDSFGVSWSQEKVEQKVIRLIEEVMKHYNIDKKKVLLTGYSMGGLGTWELAARHQDLFTAAIPISASPDPSMADIEWKIPLYVIHSKADEIIPIDNAEQVVKELQAKGASVTFVALEDLHHYNTREFLKPLHDTVDWLKQVWNMEK